MKVDQQVVTVRRERQEQESDTKLPEILIIVGNIAYWLIVVLFFKAVIDAVG